jgi:hypothetical protein
LVTGVVSLTVAGVAASGGEGIAAQAYTLVLPVGRATSVAFAAVTTGPERTPTDYTTAPTPYAPVRERIR